MDSKETADPDNRNNRNTAPSYNDAASNIYSSGRRAISAISSHLQNLRETAIALNANQDNTPTAQQSSGRSEKHENEPNNENLAQMTTDLSIGETHSFNKPHHSDTVDHSLPSYEDATSYPTAPPLTQVDQPGSSANLDSEASHLLYEEGTCAAPGESCLLQSKTLHLTRTDVLKISLGINLIRAAKRLLAFLAEVDKQGELYHGVNVKAAIFRYEHLWLPLISGKPDAIIAPPLDVHWVWLVHMLAPQCYELDCGNIAGCIIPHRLLTSKALDRARKNGKAEWEKSYPNHPWLLSSHIESFVEKDARPTMISYQLEEAIARQSAFYYQVSLPHYKAKSFLRKAEFRYRQFILLKKNHPDVFLVPCYDMDIMWHAHQVHPVIYARDTTAILGKLLPHDDSVNDRSEGSRLLTSDAITRNLWMSTYGTTFRREGSMYRGDPPSTYLKPLSESFMDSAHASVFYIEINRVKLKGSFPDGQLSVKLKQENKRLAEFTLFHSNKDASFYDVEEMNLKFWIPERECGAWVVLKVSPKKRLGKLMKFFGKGRFWCMTRFNDLVSIKKEQKLVKEFPDEDSSSLIQIEMTVKRTQAVDWVPIHILTGDFDPGFLDPDRIRSECGLVTNSKDYGTDSYLVERAHHRLVNGESSLRPQVMDVEITHSKQFLLSSIHLYGDCHTGGRSLLAVAQTLDLNTLPSYKELKCTDPGNLPREIPYLKPSDGERAMLLKIGGRDYAIVIGKWQGLRQGVRGTYSSRGIPGSPGYLHLKVFCPIHAPPYSVSLPYEDQVYAFDLKNLFLSLEAGTIQVSHRTSEFVEHVTLGLVVAVLHILCQPRMEEIIDDEIDSGGGDPVSSGHRPKRIPTERLKFLAALGFFCASAPTNSFIMKRSDDRHRDNDGGSGSDNTGARKSHIGGWYYPPMLYDAALGACGGCGGCGGGVFDTLGPAVGSLLLGSSTGQSGWMEAAADMNADAGNGGPLDVFSALFASDSGVGGGDGGDGGGDCGGDGGGCGGCGGCGG